MEKKDKTFTDDYFRCSNLTKAIEHVQRIATILHILKIVSARTVNLVNHIGRFGPLDENFRNLIAADALTAADMIIDFETCFNAKRMMDYFLSIKKILGGYDPTSNKILTGRNGKKKAIENTSRSALVSDAKIFIKKVEKRRHEREFILMMVLSFKRNI